MNLEQAYTTLGLQDPLKETGLLVNGKLRASGETTTTAIEMALDFLQNPDANFMVLSWKYGPTENYLNKSREIIIKLGGGVPKEHKIKRKTLQRQSLIGFSNGFVYCDHDNLTSKYGGKSHTGVKRLARKFFELDGDMVRVLNRDDIHLYDCTRDELIADTMLHTCCLDDLSNGLRIWSPQSEWRL